MSGKIPVIIFFSFLFVACSKNNADDYLIKFNKAKNLYINKNLEKAVLYLT